ncbi:MAG: Choline-sulfatase [Verrucomicrobia subdivision 3 bacterium]|nr:Choline-sulfatase [Limisphaerales bacterium]MCS1416334.1 Choline-sulfatase [Limisphaerales bacterium]
MLCGCLAQSAQRPNILLISIDDLNDWVGCLGGHPQALTPNIDRLARRGTLFTNAHCQSPVCNPSRASMLTGRYPHSTGIYFLSPPLTVAPALKNVLTLPEYFAKHGYHTLAVGKIFHGNDKRFFHEYGGNNGGFGPRPKKKISQPHGHPLWDWGVFPDSDDKMPDMIAAKWAINKLNQDHNQPFLLGVGFYRPHVPMFATQEWFDRHPRETIQLPLVKDDDRNDLSQYAINLTNLEHVAPKHEWIKTAGEWDQAVQAYLASVTFVDHCLGLVLDALDAGPHARNTIIVLFSDHGFHLGEKQRWAKRSLWEDGTRVPLIISAPGYTASQRCPRPAELLDIFPTLLDLAGLEPDENQEGQSLVPLMQNPIATWNHPAITSFGPGNYSVRSTRYRLIQYADSSREFYDHQNDRHEWTNLSQNPELKDLITKHAAHIPAKEHDLLSGNSTGHKAFDAANQRLAGR